MITIYVVTAVAIGFILGTQFVRYNPLVLEYAREYEQWEIRQGEVVICPYCCNPEPCGINHRPGDKSVITVHYDLNKKETTDE